MKRTKIDEELTFDEKYKIEVSLVVNQFSVEYAGCGTHQLEIEAEFELKELQDLFDKLKIIKGIKTK